MGHGLQEGADLTVPIALLQRLNKQRKPQQEMVLHMLVQGAFWPKTRRLGPQAHVDDLWCP
eukprot:5960892-Prorocentrum_lima.AAC.1